MSLHTIDVDPASFRRDIASWDGQDPSFSHLLLTAMAQCLLYGSGSMLMAGLAGEFGVRLDDVRSWALGISEPEPAVRRRVVASIGRHLDETVRVYLRFHDRLPLASSATYGVAPAKAAV